MKAGDVQVLSHEFAHDLQMWAVKVMIGDHEGRPQDRLFVIPGQVIWTMRDPIKRKIVEQMITNIDYHDVLVKRAAEP